MATSAKGTEVRNSPILVANQDASFKITLQPGESPICCSVDAHRSLGMEASITSSTLAADSNMPSAA